MDKKTLIFIDHLKRRNKTKFLIKVGKQKNYGKKKNTDHRPRPIIGKKNLDSRIV